MGDVQLPVPLPVARRVARILAAAALCGAVLHCHGREPSARPPAVEFKAGGVVPTQLVGITAAQERLWVTTDAGVVAIDPVAERWTTLHVGARRIMPSRVIACGSDLWLELQDTVAFLDLKRGQLWTQTALPPAVFRPGELETCGPDALWIYTSGNLYRVPAAGGGAERHQVARTGRALPQLVAAAYLQGAIYFLASRDYRVLDDSRGLFRFDPVTSQLGWVPLPKSAVESDFVQSLERVDEGLLAKTASGHAFLLRGEGQALEETLEAYAGPVLAAGDSVVWVGASYDVSPASYFVLRYIRKAREPKDLVVLPQWWPVASRLPPAVQYLGMLWGVSDTKILRVDPNADELVSYQLQDSTGRLAKKAFHLTPGELQFFGGDTLRPAPPP